MGLAGGLWNLIWIIIAIIILVVLIRFLFHLLFILPTALNGEEIVNTYNSISTYNVSLDGSLIQGCVLQNMNLKTQDLMVAFLDLEIF